MLECNPVLVEVTRGGAVESAHRGAVVAVEAGPGGGEPQVVACWGDAGRPVFPRSALKPVQALPLVETGAAAAFGLSDAELALACASHAGEPRHVERVARWLARIGLGAEALECGAHAPANAEAARALAQAGERPSALHNNCSGKHTGFLTVARHLGVQPGGYIRPDHPVQRLVSMAVADLAGVDLAGLPAGTDGCGIPVHGLPLAALARALARLPGRPAGRALLAAMSAHPDLIAGSGRLCSVVMAAVPSLVLKGGAEGVYVAVHPGRGLGVAVKIDDGAGRAAEVAVMAVLDRLGLLSAAEKAALAHRLRPPVLNVAGLRVGEIRPAPGW